MSTGVLVRGHDAFDLVRLDSLQWTAAVIDVILYSNSSSSSSNSIPNVSRTLK